MRTNNVHTTLYSTIIVHNTLNSHHLPANPSGVQWRIHKYERANLMAKLSDILKVAQQRGRETNLPYEGSLTPVEAYEILNESPIARLIDVRTQAEVDWVGYVAGALTIEWQGYPDRLPNLQFIEQLKAAAPDDALLLFLCRSGVRSGLAAGALNLPGFGASVGSARFTASRTKM